MRDYIPFDWSLVDDRTMWLEPCEESWYYAEKWRREGKEYVLDLGCGLGRHSVLFAKYGFKVTALDVSDEALAFLQNYCKEQCADVRCKNADMEEMPFEDNTFDCIFAMHSAGHTDADGMTKIMNEVKRVLRPGGEVFMTLCSKETWTYKQPDLPRLDDNTVVKNDGPEQGVPHYFVDESDIKRLFSEYELIRVRHIDDCFCDGEWKNQKHYFIEAAVHK